MRIFSHVLFFFCFACLFVIRFRGVRLLLFLLLTIVHRLLVLWSSSSSASSSSSSCSSSVSCLLHLSRCSSLNCLTVRLVSLRAVLTLIMHSVFFVSVLFVCFFCLFVCCVFPLLSYSASSSCVPYFMLRVRRGLRLIISMCLLLIMFLRRRLGRVLRLVSLLSV